ncbi:hypothetical protein TREMEDRAFT_72589 [Tremella mesenterica DSM 1558]|uniref:uncharacterized protein n=1 Tax=Tremella mesenterica (strain ATCC 24925 / CBS 8224 / DSM 1558 / NBRC 9311 / NRRL Y-6157 / RJB 2259-6 / UBC 559-6) TaxID=578456 RepID=UPI00032BA396|nr:uncharacterized protein TREMEDRAFT_72589 [Tremella mesenterica DSM 1558]EIW65474.1 hypothetical protein TREMEDRAFT_72589 [Tremella mesenterica DSM 1558]
MPSRRLHLSSGSHKRKATEGQDFMAVILVGYGDNLYPFNEGINVVSKALIPVANRPIISFVLDWVFQSGIMDVLLIVPPLFHSSISNHLNENYSTTTHPGARITLKQHDEGQDEDGEEPRGESSMAMERDGTARLLKQFRHLIETDFVLLPCDISTPANLPLSSILDKHRAAPDAVMTCVLYEPVDSVRESEEKVLVALDRESEELLLVLPLDCLEDDLDLRMSLLLSHPTLSLTTRLLDAHIYVFRHAVLELLASRQTRDLDSVREQVVPWLVKGAWQKGLSSRWQPTLDPPGRDPLASALLRSTTLTHNHPTHLSVPSSPGSFDPSAASTRRETPAWKCQLVISAPAARSAPEPAIKKGGKDKSKPTPVVEPEYLIRSNSLAGYWEMNRRALRKNPLRLSAEPAPSPPSTPSEDAAVSSSAQISPDSMIGEGTRIGERASVKKSILGRHCVIGRGSKITGSILWDFVTVEENARIENSILCSNVRLGEKTSVKDCEFGTGFEAKAGANLKGERLVAGQEA